MEAKLLLEVLTQLLGGLAHMHEVAVRAAGAGAFIELAAARLPEVRHRRVLDSQLSACIVPAVESQERLLGVLLIAEPHVDIAHHVIPEVLAHLHVIHFAKLLKFLKDLLVELVEVLLQLGAIHMR